MSGIVVGIDESVHSHRALDWAMREAALRRTDLTVFTVIPAMASPWSSFRIGAGTSSSGAQARMAATPCS